MTKSPTSSADVAPFPIRELSRRTGIKTSTLRAWETRHHLLQPLRTPSGHRLYNDADTQRVLQLQELLAEGHGLAEAARLLVKAPPSRLAAPWAGQDKEAVPSAWGNLREEMIEATECFSSQRLDEVYGEACSLYPIDVIDRDLLLPILERLGERWRLREAGIAEEHFFSAWLRNKLGARLHHHGGGTGGRLICACLPGEQHEIGLLVFALAALARNYRIIYLGADMPLNQIPPIVESTRARAVVLAGREPAEPARMVTDISELVKRVKVPVFVGSHFARTSQTELSAAGARPVGDDIMLALARIEAGVPA